MTTDCSWLLDARRSDRTWRIVWWGSHHWRGLGFEKDRYGRVLCFVPLALYRKAWDEDGGASWTV